MFDSAARFPAGAKPPCDRNPVRARVPRSVPVVPVSTSPARVPSLFRRPRAPSFAPCGTFRPRDAFSFIVRVFARFEPARATLVPARAVDERVSLKHVHKRLGALAKVLIVTTFTLTLSLTTGEIKTEKKMQ